MGSHLLINIYDLYFSYQQVISNQSMHQVFLLLHLGTEPIPLDIPDPSHMGIAGSTTCTIGIYQTCNNFLVIITRMSRAGFELEFQPSEYLNLTDNLAHSATTAGLQTFYVMPCLGLTPVKTIFVYFKR